MVGSGLREKSKEALGVIAIHEALRSVCLNSDWTYSVFWTIRPRPRIRGGNGCKLGDDNGSLMLMWEDGFCRSRSVVDGEEDPVRKAFSKMSIQLYNYGEGWVMDNYRLRGSFVQITNPPLPEDYYLFHELPLRLMGKVASDKCHKWVFKEPTESEPNNSNYWQSSFDSVPSEWTDQFESGIQTIAVIQAGHGLLQLGSCKIVAEDLHFVLRMRHTFESLGYQSGLYLSQLFSSTRNNPTLKQPISQPPPPLFNWEITRPTPSSSPAGFAIPPSDHDDENDIKWPNGLTFFNALTGQADQAKLLFNPEGLGSINPNQCLDSKMEMEMEDKFKRSFSLPARMASLTSLTSPDLHAQEYGNEGGMEAFWE